MTTPGGKVADKRRRWVINDSGVYAHISGPSVMEDTDVIEHRAGDVHLTRAEFQVVRQVLENNLYEVMTPQTPIEDALAILNKAEVRK